MSAVMKAEKQARPKSAADLAQELIAFMRSERRAPPAGDPADLRLQLELIEKLLERGVAFERERAPGPITQYDLNTGRHVEVSPAQQVRLRDNPVLCGLATWASHIQDRLAAKGSARGAGDEPQTG